MTPQQTRMFRGRRYNAEKQDRGGDRKSNGHISKVQNAPLISTADRIGEQSGVDGATIKRDAAYAESVDSLAKPARDAIASGEVKALHRCRSL